MAKVFTDDRNYGDIADAIRSKLNVETLYLPSEMAEAIESIETGTELTSEDEGKVVVEDAGSYVLTEQSTLNVSQNGTYDTTVNDEVVVNVQGGGGGATVMSRQQWNALTVAEKQAYGLVGIYDSNTGYIRGDLVSGSDYSDIQVYLPNSTDANVKCLANYDNFVADSSSWGIGSSPIVASSALSTYQSEDAIYFDALTGGKNAHISLGDTTSDFTVYVVAKGIQYASGDVIVMGSVNSWNNNNLVMLYHRSGTVWTTSIYGSDEALTDTGGDYAAVAIRSGSMKASWFASDGGSRTNIAYNSHGTDFTFGYRGTTFSSDLAVKFVGYVAEAETNQQIVANLANLAEIFNIS